MAHAMPNTARPTTTGSPASHAPPAASMNMLGMVTPKAPPMFAPIIRMPVAMESVLGFFRMSGIHAKAMGMLNCDTAAKKKMNTAMKPTGMLKQKAKTTALTAPMAISRMPRLVGLKRLMIQPMSTLPTMPPREPMETRLLAVTSSRPAPRGDIR